MQLRPTPVSLFAGIILILSSCGQATKTGTTNSDANVPAKDTVTIYVNMSSAVCNCITTTMIDNKPSTVMDSCFKKVTRQYTDSLKAMGFDPTSSKGQSKMFKEMARWLNGLCPVVGTLLDKEADDKNKLLFKGSFVSQQKLSNGTYEVTLQDNTTKEQTVFKSKFPFDEKSVQDYLPGYEMTMEYQLVLNKTTGKNEFYLKQTTPISTIGATAVKK